MSLSRQILVQTLDKELFVLKAILTRFACKPKMSIRMLKSNAKLLEKVLKQ